jgi:hypothetical protein
MSSQKSPPSTTWYRARLRGYGSGSKDDGAASDVRFPSINRDTQPSINAHSAIMTSLTAEPWVLILEQCGLVQEAQDVLLHQL